jgi:hypothetical protein
LFGVGWCRVRFCGWETSGLQLQVWLLQLLLWLWLASLAKLLLGLLLLLSRQLRWLHLLWKLL